MSRPITAAALAALLAAAVAAPSAFAKKPVQKQDHLEQGEYDPLTPRNCIAELDIDAPAFLASSPLKDYIGSDFQVISFGNVTAPRGGDVGGRLAAAGDINLGDGFAIGWAFDKPASWRNPPVAAKHHYDETYSLVFGGSSAIWRSGSLSPRYSGFYGGASIAPSADFPRYLAHKQHGACGTAGCLDEAFADLKAAYSALADSFAAAAADGTAALVNDGLEFSYPTLKSRLIFHVPAAIFNNASHYHIDVPSETEIIIVITHTDEAEVRFDASEFPHPDQKLLYVFAGEGPRVYAESSVQGSILAPHRTFFQEEGVSDNGFLIFGNIERLIQVNFIRCARPGTQPPPTTTTTTTTAAPTTTTTWKWEEPTHNDWNDWNHWNDWNDRHESSSSSSSSSNDWSDWNDWSDDSDWSDWNEWSSDDHHDRHGSWNRWGNYRPHHNRPHHNRHHRSHHRPQHRPHYRHYNDWSDSTSNDWNDWRQNVGARKATMPAPRVAKLSLRDLINGKAPKKA